MTKPFKNQSHAGNEKAIRRGRRVPEGDVNLAYVKAPALSPDKNVVIVDTSRVTQGNESGHLRGCKLYYANPLGILMDENENMVVPEEFPNITDVFSIEEDFNVAPGSEYTTDHILPYRHTSRYFHLDKAGLTMGGDEVTYQNNHIKVVDERGNEYDNYKVRIVAAYLPDADIDPRLSDWAYRVFVYIDTQDNEGLYLRYHKTELTPEGELVRRNINHKEILNPEPFFTFMPEESDVADLQNRNKKWYSSKPISFEDQVLGRPSSGAEGYKIYVPKKAVGDPRLYQIFRWRVKCTFQQDATVDPSRGTETVKCGVITTAADKATRATDAAYAFFNLQNSHYNINKIKFINPAKKNHSYSERKKRGYWLVDLDKQNIDDYDILIWAPTAPQTRYDKYAGKIDHFVRNKGGTLFIDTNRTDIWNKMGGSFSRRVVPYNGSNIPGFSGNSNTKKVFSRDENYAAPSHDLLSENLGGWKIDATTLDVDSLSYTQLPNPGYSNCITTLPHNFTSIIRAKDTASSNYLSVVAAKSLGKGNIIASTFGVLFTCSAFIKIGGAGVQSNNYGSTISTSGSYSDYINNPYVEGAMKLLYNAALMGVSGKIADDSDETSFSTNWEYSTPWKGSWVIDADNGVLTAQEREEHNFLLDARDPAAGDTRPVWKRRLSNKTLKNLIDSRVKELEKDPAVRQRIQGATRTYEIEVTNPYVKVQSGLGDGNYPQVWTEAYTPKFEVPVELGSHIIKREGGDDGRGTKIDFTDNVTFKKRSYPDQPYSVQASVVYVDTEEVARDITTNYTATGTAVGTKKITETSTISVTSTSDVELSWWDARVRGTSGEGGPEQAGSLWPVHMGFPYFGALRPKGIRTWQDDNYYSNGWGPGNLIWGYWGMNLKLVIGSTGDAVKFVQEALNRFQQAKYFGTSAGTLPIDGVYGSKTSRAIRDFQITLQARYVDGVIDAETWSLIGSQINRLASEGRLGPVNSGDHTRFFSRYKRMQHHHLSDGSESVGWAKRSWISGGPSIIWDMIAITFDQKYDFRAVSVVPYLEGAANNLMVRSIHVTNERSLSNYNSQNGQLIYMPHRPADGQELVVPFGPYNGNTIIIGIGQDNSAGWGSSRMIGIRDIRGHTTVSTLENRTVTNVRYQKKDLNFQVTGKVKVNSFGEKVVQLQAPQFPGYESVSNIRFTGISVSNPDVNAVITSSGKATFTTSAFDIATTSNYNKGPKLPSGTYYSMDQDKRFDPIPETGWVSKNEGLKLLCTKDKKPYGFPSSLPTAAGGGDEAARHYAKYVLSNTGNASTVYAGFYDVNKDEFITTVDGKPEMSYIEYVERGKNNVFIAVITDHEVVTNEVIPEDDDAPRLPHKWALPVYGVCFQGGSKITLEPLPPNLNSDDLWPVAVRDGEFTRSVKLRRRSKRKLTGYLSKYQGQKVDAFYDIPEADKGGWSTMYGKPNADVIDEEPMILDDDIIRVRQTPILMAHLPTEHPNPADPYRPIITLYKRPDRNSAWVKQPFTAIRDYNAKTGEIYLREPLTSNDTSLLRVDYTTKRRNYYFKRQDERLLNLNAYSGHMNDLIGEAIYIYIVPHFVKDANGRVIQESVTRDTLRMTTSPNIFDPLDPEYNPLAARLGVIYISTALDVTQVGVIDTRRRGGGLKDNANVHEVMRLVNDAATYWDIEDATGHSYQRSGFVVIRLPEDLKYQFSEKELRRIVGRNITAGVEFRLESYDGREVFGEKTNSIYGGYAETDTYLTTIDGGDADDVTFSGGVSGGSA